MRKNKIFTFASACFFSLKCPYVGKKELDVIFITRHEKKGILTGRQKR